MDFKSIIEEMINEVDANQAFDKWYNKCMSREDYDKILDGNPNPDKVYQFILNSVRDGKCDVDGAVEAVKTYKGITDSVVKQRIDNMIKNGEIETPYDIEDALKSFEFGVTSRKKWAKEGLVNIGTFGEWRVTATLNYEANNHYFGASHWCTASDRLGHYDGYTQFRNYTNNSTLVQITNINDSTNAFQAQISINQYEKDKVGFGTICDYEDHIQNSNFLHRVIGDEAYNAITDYNTIKKLIELTKGLKDKEWKYQNSRAEYYQKKRDRIELQRRLSYERMEREAKEYNDRENERKVSLVKEGFKRIINGDKELYQRILNARYKSEDIYMSDYYREDYTESQQIEYDLELIRDDINEITKNFYIGVDRMFKLSENEVLLFLTMFEGETMAVNEIYDDEDNSTPTKRIFFITASDQKHYLSLHVKTDCEKLGKDPRELSTNDICVYGDIISYKEVESAENIFPRVLQQNGESMRRRRRGDYNNTIISLGKTLFCTNTKQFIDTTIDNISNYRGFIESCGKTFLYSEEEYDEDYNSTHLNYVEISNNEVIEQGIIKSFFNCKGVLAGYFNDEPSCRIILNNENTQDIVYGPQGTNVQLDGVFIIDIRNAPEVHFCGNVDEEEYCFLWKHQGYYNITNLNNPTEYIYGFWSDYTSTVTTWTIERKYWFYMEEPKTERNLRYCHGHFYYRDRNTIGQHFYTPSNNVGERVSDKNFQKWQANGGHSQQAKDEMDKMWADRSNELNKGIGKEIDQAYDELDKIHSDEASKRKEEKIISYALRELMRRHQDEILNDYPNVESYAYNNKDEFERMIKFVRDNWNDTVNDYWYPENERAITNQIDEMRNQIKNLLDGLMK